MAYQITGIHVSTDTLTHKEIITKVQLSDGTTESVEQVIRYLDSDYDYFYMTKNGKKERLQAIHDSILETHLQTKNCTKQQDSMFELPRF
ncbi:hypothetical protein [Lactococcus sp.]|uniref:hypothetical protein n=1 Tax=Lactococcus sp. TaxID=44273 RepID=UPI0035B090C3